MGPGNASLAVKVKKANWGEHQGKKSTTGAFWSVHRSSSIRTRGGRGVPPVDSMSKVNMGCEASRVRWRQKKVAGAEEAATT